MLDDYHLTKLTVTVLSCLHFQYTTYRIIISRFSKLSEAAVHICHSKYRSSRPEVFCKIGVLRNFAKFTGKQLCQSLFFNKVAGLWPATLLTPSTRLCIRLSTPSTPATLFKKKKTLAQVFSYEFCEISKITFFHRTPLMAASENRCS